MLPGEYQTLQAYETWYWWYVAQRENLISTVGRLRPRRGARVLDAGCGTGWNLHELARTFNLSAHGVDASPHAAALWNGPPNVRRCLASVNELPYDDRTFDLVTSVDVFGCRGVDIRRALSEAARVLRPGGHLVLLVPAYQWMRSRHDEAVASERRFTRRELRSLAADAGLAIEQLTHRFPLFLPAVAAVRLVRKVWLNRGRETVRSDLSPLPRVLNRLLLGIARIEHALVRNLPVPFGSTILLVARKDSP